MRVISKRGQLTLFIIIALILVVGIIGFFVFRGYFVSTPIPTVAQPVYQEYMSCIESLTLEGTSILGAQGGYIESPDFEPGSFFMPFSSHLDFLGIGVPYWYYISGNNLIRERIPTKSEMEAELENYIRENIQFCDFQDFERQGYLIDIDDGEVNLDIRDNEVRVNIKNELRLSFDEEFFVFSEHNLDVDSKIGSFYNLAIEIYERQKNELFLENYALDTLKLNAPTASIEEGCAPLFFNFNEIRSDVAEALSENIAHVKVRGSYYFESDEYFVEDLGRNVDKTVNFLYSPEWPTKIEIFGDEFIEPVGLQEGTAILGYCFAEYEFLYDLGFPVLIQLSDERETFQFPVVVHLERNQIRPAPPEGDFLFQEQVVCRNMNQEMEIRVVDFDGNPVPASISMQCLGESCYLGDTSESTNSNGILRTMAPRCVNGFIEARAEGYSTGRYMISSNEDTSAEILMKKIHDVEIDLGNIQGEAVVHFSSHGYSGSISYPQITTIQLVEGIYDVSVQVFTDSSLNFPSRREQRCFDVPHSDLTGLFGGSSVECYDIEIPAQDIDRVLIGGGSSVEFLSESSFREFSKFEIDVPLFSNPTRIEDIMENYIKLEDSFISVRFVP